MDNYRVIEIIDEYTLIINYGLDAGAQQGENLRIFTVGEPVLDPMDKSSLGTLDIIKGTVEVVTPYPAFSICKKIIRHELSILNPLSNLVQTKKSINKLNVSDEDLSHRKLPDISPIKVGDNVMILPTE